MKIAIIGAGNVGQTLGRGWAKAGHQISYGVKNPQDEKSRALKAGQPQAAITTNEASQAGHSRQIFLKIYFWRKRPNAKSRPCPRTSAR